MDAGKLPESEGISKEEREFYSSRTEGIQNGALLLADMMMVNIEGRESQSFC